MVANTSGRRVGTGHAAFKCKISLNLSKKSAKKPVSIPSAVLTFLLEISAYATGCEGCVVVSNQQPLVTSTVAFFGKEFCSKE